MGTSTVSLGHFKHRVDDVPDIHRNVQIKLGSKGELLRARTTRARCEKCGVGTEIGYLLEDGKRLEGDTIKDLYWRYMRAE